MSYYIVCQKKRNNPRMDIRICNKKCDIKGDCAEYKSSCKILSQSDARVEGAEAVQMQAA